MFKVISNIAATLTDDLFTTYQLLTIYLLRIIVTIFAQNPSLLLQVCTVHSGQNSIRYHHPIIWNMMPGYIKDFETLDIFKGKI